MIFKLVILTALGLTYSQDVKFFDVDEKGSHFDEIMVVDKDKNTLELRSPSHGDREASIRMEFKEEGFYAVKQFAKNSNDNNLCFFGKLEADSKESATQDEKAFEKTNGKLPRRKKIIHHIELPVPADLDEVPDVIKQFCLSGDRQFKIVKARYEDGRSMRDIEKEALKIARESKHDERKRAVVREFIACTNASTMKIMTCPGDKLKASCHIRRPSCTYKISCPMDAGAGGFNCEGLHKLNSIVCCDYDC